MIYDTAGNEILSAAFSMSSADVKTATIQIDCTAGQYLRGEAVSGLTVEAKQEDAVSWTNIETTPIDLATWDGTTETFLVRFTAPSIAEYTRKTFRLSVGP